MLNLRPRAPQQQAWGAVDACDRQPDSSSGLQRFLLRKLTPRGEGTAKAYKCVAKPRTRFHRAPTPEPGDRWRVQRLRRIMTGSAQVNHVWARTLPAASPANLTRLCPSGNTWQGLETVLVVTTGDRVLLASLRKKLGMLLSILYCAGPHLKTGITWP